GPPSRWPSARCWTASPGQARRTRRPTPSRLASPSRPRRNRQDGIRQLADPGCQVLVGGQELVPPRLAIDAPAPADVRGEILDVDLDPGPVLGEQIHGHAPLLDDQDGLV